MSEWYARPRNLNVLPGEAALHKSLVRAGFTRRDQSRVMNMFRATQLVELEKALPLDMVLHCPNCSQQHIDAPAEGWDNPPHRSHLCGGCGHVWRPADVPTNGVAKTHTKSKDDTPTALGGGIAVSAARYAKLRRWMTSNVKEGWDEVCRLGAVGSWMSWEEFDLYLDGLPECNVGLVAKRDADD